MGTMLVLVHIDPLVPVDGPGIIIVSLPRNFHSALLTDFESLTGQRIWLVPLVGVNAPPPYLSTQQSMVSLVVKATFSMHSG